jgi:hypothetical protein
MNAVVEMKQGALAQTQGSDRMAVAEILSHVTRVQEVMRSVMKGPSKEHPNGVHYGVIPGTDKPTLLKPGAELLCMTFRIGATYQVEDLSTDLVVRYRVTCTGTHQTTGTMLGTGMGEASSGEEKYKWVKAYPEEWNATPENLRRTKFGWDKTARKKYEVLQVRTEPANLANTILKMANKRAYLAMVLSVTAASDCFAQDLEDMEERLREHLTEHGGEQHTESGDKAGDAQKKPYPADTFDKGMVAWQKAVNKGKTPAEVLAVVEQTNPEFALSEEQRAKILALQPASKGAATDVAPKVTFAQVDEKMRAARTPDQLNEAASLIDAVADPKQREELKATYQEMVDAMNDPHAGEPQ